MDHSPDNEETLWDALLSRQPELIVKVFNSLNETDQQAVIFHLKRMSTEEGWYTEQVTSAKSALNALNK